jgi:hypothetical protein
MIARVACGWIPAVCAVVLIGVLVGGGGTSYSAPTGTELPARDTEEAGSTVFLPLVTVDPRLTPEQAAEYLADNIYTDPKYSVPADDPIRDITQETAKTAFDFITTGDLINKVKEGARPEFRDYVELDRILINLNSQGHMLVQVPIMTVPWDEDFTHQEDYVPVVETVRELEDEMYGPEGLEVYFSLGMNNDVEEGFRVVLNFFSPKINNAEAYERLKFDDRGRLIIEFVEIPGFTE